MTEWLGLPALASAHGGEIDNLIGWIHVFMLVLFVGWSGGGCSGTGDCVVTLGANTTVTATFRLLGLL